MVTLLARGSAGVKIWFLLLLYCALLLAWFVMDHGMEEPRWAELRWELGFRVGARGEVWVQETRELRRLG